MSEGTEDADVVSLIDQEGPAERAVLATGARRARREELSDQVAVWLILQTHHRRRGPGRKP